MKGRRKKNEIIANFVEVSLGNLHSATVDTNKPMFPKGLFVSSSSEPKYTYEAQRKFKELYDIYWDIMDESNN